MPDGIQSALQVNPHNIMGITISISLKGQKSKEETG